uniref:MOSC domain containing protein n=1 Tax=Salinispora arenicola (strain CNS-205) TaxID=391037 RepID=A8M4I9_SALAI
MRLSAIHTYPVKGGRRCGHAAAQVLPWGLAGDRRWMVVDAAGVGITQREVAGLVTLRAVAHPGGLTLRAAGHPDLDVPEPVDGVPVAVRTFRSRKLDVWAHAAGSAADAWVSGFLGRPARLVWLARPTRHIPAADREHDPGDRVTFADQYPVLLANTASLDVLNGWLVEAGEPPVPMNRFRPNLVVSEATAWAEDGWAGRRVRIGGIGFRAAAPAGRCVVITTDQDSGVRGKEPLVTLGRYRRVRQKIRFGVHLVPVDTGRVVVGDEVVLAG